MSDLIRKQDAIDAVHYYIESGYKCDIFQELKNLPSIEPEQTSKVYKKQAPDKLYYFYCGNCGEMIDCSSYEDYKSIKSYCPYCGAKLDWSE